MSEKQEVSALYSHLGNNTIPALPSENDMHELVPFLAIHAARYQEDYGLNGLHPTHYDLMVKYGARMDSFKRATNALSPDHLDAQVAGPMK